MEMLQSHPGQSAAQSADEKLTYPSAVACLPEKSQGICKSRQEQEMDACEDVNNIKSDSMTTALVSAMQ